MSLAVSKQSDAHPLFFWVVEAQDDLSRRCHKACGSWIIGAHSSSMLVSRGRAAQPDSGHSARQGVAS